MISSKRPMRPSFEELVERECRVIARDILEKKLAEHNLPLPESNLDVHLDNFISLNPNIVEAARRRVELRLDAYSTALKMIGIDNSPAEAMEL